MITEDAQKLFDKCLAEIITLNISLPDNLRFGGVEHSPWSVYISFYDDRTEITVAEELLKFPVEMIKAEIIDQILSIEDRQQKYKRDLSPGQREHRAAEGYDFSRNSAYLQPLL